MDRVDQIFAQLDDWRHLPTYQLERRADIFFSLYLPKILKAATGIEINDIVIPEFPLHTKTLFPKAGNNQSYRADYFALSKNRKRAFLIELKTDGQSNRDAQDRYLNKAKEVRLPKLLKGLRNVFEVTNQKRKYFCLFKKLEALGLVTNLAEFEGIMKQERLNGFKAALADGAQTSDLDPDISLICIQPALCSKRDNGRPFDGWISFEDVRKVVSRHKDSVSIRFAESLKDWKTPAGE